MRYIANMKTIKFTVFLALFAVLAIGAFGDSFYSIAGSYYGLNDLYPDEKYGRDMQGGSFIIMLNYYPETNPVGWYLRTSFGGSSTGIEWKGNSMSEIDGYSSSDIQISAGPSYRFKLGRIIHLPLSLGPIFSIIREESYYISDSCFSNFLNLGMHLDAALVLNPIKALTIINGLYTSVDFLHWERGSTRGKYRSINSGKFEFQNYAAIKLGFYVGIGLHFD